MGRGGKKKEAKIRFFLTNRSAERSCARMPCRFAKYQKNAYAPPQAGSSGKGSLYIKIFHKVVVCFLLHRGFVLFGARSDQFDRFVGKSVDALLLIEPLSVSFR